MRVLNYVPKVLRTCECCGKQFVTHSNYISKGWGKFCSRACRAAWQSEHLKGENAPQWKGENIGYGRKHEWLTQTYGQPTPCDYCGVEGKQNRHWSVEWALIKGKQYERKRENFMKLCISCHRRYDFTEMTRKKISLAKLGQRAWNKGLKGTLHHSEETRNKIGASSRARWANKVYAQETKKQMKLAGELKRNRYKHAA